MNINHGNIMAYGLLFTLVFHLIRESEALQVIGGSTTVVQGGDATLPCRLIETQESLTQITWQKKTREKPQNANFFTIQPETGPQFVDGDDKRFKFNGTFNDNIGTLVLSNVTLKDEGIYTCIFTLFPSGNHKTEIPLNVLVPPLTSLKSNTPSLGSDEVTFATCTAADSRPPAEVKWITGSLAEKVRETANSTQNANGTTTTVSSLVGVPSREISNHLVQCVITSPALDKEETLPFSIQVHYPPMEVNIIKTSKDSFECEAKANPPASFLWKRSGKLLSHSSVKVDGAKLYFLSWTADLNDLYECEASNQYGKNDVKLYVAVRVGQGIAGWVLFGLLLFVNVVGLVLWYLKKSGHLQSIAEYMPTRQQESPRREASTEQRELQEQPST